MRNLLLLVGLVAAGAAQADQTFEQKLGAQVAAVAAAGGWQDGFDRVAETHFEPGLGTSPEEARAAEADRTITVGSVVLRPERALSDQLAPAWVVPLWNLGRKEGHAAIRRQLVADLAAAADKAGLSAEERGPIVKTALVLYDEHDQVWALGTLEAPLGRLGAGVLAPKNHVLGLGKERGPDALRFTYEAMARALVARVTNESVLPDETPSGG